MKLNVQAMKALRSGRLMSRARLLINNDFQMIESLIKIREAQGLKQDQVAEMLGITQPSVAAFERNDGDPKLSTIRRYALAIGANIDHIVEPDMSSEFVVVLSQTPLLTEEMPSISNSWIVDGRVAAQQNYEVRVAENV